VGWGENDVSSISGWDSREASIISAVITFDPTPDTWFYKYDPGVLQDWNLNPEENAGVSFAAKYTLSRYFTGTDRLQYYDSNGNIVWESPGIGSPWPTKGYIGAFNFLSKVLLPRWMLLFDIGVGESLATNSFDYTTSTAQEKPITDYFTFSVSAKTGPYTGKLLYNHDFWGPEQWHRQFGEIYDDLYRLLLSRQFGEYINAGIEGTFARKDPNLYFAPELGQYDEIRAFLSIAFGPIIPYFGGEKPGKELLVGAAPEVDYTPPQVALSVSTTGFTPNGDGYDDIIDLEPWASDLSGIARWKIEIKDSDDQLVKTISGEGQPPFSVEWDGKDDIYRKTVPEGEYAMTLTAVDEADNSATSSIVRVNVSIPPKVITREVIREIQKEIKVTETARGLQVSLTSRVLFDTDKSNLKPSAGKTLQEVLKVLNAYPDNKISIEGHTDSVGSAQYNQRLSERRAWSVANYLIKAGIPSERVKVVGFGEEKPVASNATAAGREANRRVEVIILQ
jgi:outer membrane protein OmpA-like peptidoglycan-associated protein